jgi:hypothetical protein
VRLAIFIAQLLISLPLICHAFEPLGDTFQVNTSTADSLRAAIAPLNDGGFVVVWDGRWPPGPSYPGVSVFAQRFDGDALRVGTEFRVSVDTTNPQWSPRVAGTADGGFVVVWTDGAYHPSIVARKYTAEGLPENDGTAVDVEHAAAARQAVITTAGDGFVVVWESSNHPAYETVYRPLGRRLDSSAQPFGPEFEVDIGTAGFYAHPAIAGDSSGGFVLVWNVGDRWDSGIVLRRYGTDAEPLGDVFVLTPHVRSPPALAFTTDGSFVVTWANYRLNVLARRFSPSGEALGTEFDVNVPELPLSIVKGVTTAPAIAAGQSGDFLVIWGREGFPPVRPQGMAARRLSRDGKPLGTEFQVNTSEVSVPHNTAAAALEGGRFVVAWDSYGETFGREVFARAFATVPACGDFTVEGTTTASDALFALQASVGAVTCLPCICDANGSGSIEATDAAILLHISVGQPQQLHCPAC